MVMGEALQPLRAAVAGVAEGASEPAYQGHQQQRARGTVQRQVAVPLACLLAGRSWHPAPPPGQTSRTGTRAGSEVGIAQCRAWEGRACDHSILRQGVALQLEK